MNKDPAIKIDWSNLPLSLMGRSIIPFTGPFFAIYAFFWPESFGNWFGSIIKAFRNAAGV